MGFILWVQELFNINKSKMWYTLNRSKNKDHTIIQWMMEKLLTKFKTCHNWNMKGPSYRRIITEHNNNSYMTKHLTQYSILWKFFCKIRNKTKMPTSITPAHFLLLLDFVFSGIKDILFSSIIPYFINI
jgi:hypothetical protein